MSADPIPVAIVRYEGPGKVMEPTPGYRRTILFGRCMSRRNKDRPAVREAIEIPECPATPKTVAQAFRKAAIEIDTAILDDQDKLRGTLLARYAGNPVFDESFFRIE